VDERLGDDRLLAVIEAGSLSGAARALGLAQPTVGRHIEALEIALGGSPLFTRSPGGLRPTEAALALRPHAQAMAAAAETLIRTASGEADSVGGVVRVTASDIVGAEVLPPILTAFRERHGRARKHGWAGTGETRSGKSTDRRA